MEFKNGQGSDDGDDLTPTPVSVGWRVRAADLASASRTTVERIEQVSCSDDPDLGEAAAACRTLATVYLELARLFEKASK